MKEDDLSGAYWLVRSLRVQDQNPGFGDWLLATTQGARWLGTSPDLFVTDLLELATEHQPDTAVSEELLGLAAALAPSLAASASGLVGWLKRPSCCTELHRMTEAVRFYASYGIGLRPEDLLGVSGAERRNQLIREATAAARDWLESAPQKKTQMRRANDVWLRLVRNELQKLLTPVAADRRDQAEEVRSLISQWQNRAAIFERIHEVDGELAKRRIQPIVGAPRDKIVRDFVEGWDLARHWYDLVWREQEIQARGDWLFDRVTKLREELREAIPAAERALEELVADERPAHIAAPAICLRRSIWQVRKITGLSGDLEYGTEPWASLVSGADTLAKALARRLLWMPELELEDDCQPTPASVPGIADALRISVSEGRTLLAAHEAWMRKEDYRFLESIQSMLPPAENTPALTGRVQEAREASRGKLREEMAHTTERIEQAVVDGVIFDERSEYDSIVAAINPDHVLNVAARLRRLEKVRSGLAEALEARLEGQRQHWSSLQEQLTASNLPADIREKVRTRIDQTIARRDTRLLDEFLAQLRESLEGGAELPASWIDPPQERDVLEEYLRLLSPLEETLKGGLNLILRMLKQGDWPPPLLPFPRIMPAPRMAEAAGAFEAWGEMRRSRPGVRDILHHIETLLRYVGFNLPSAAARPVTLQEEGPDWVHFRVRMTDGRLSPVPQFGSQAGGQYDVVSVWERPGVDTIRSWLQELRLDDRPVLLVYLARLSAPQRRNLTRMFRRGEMSVLTLDETLLLLLSAERDARLPVFMRCALPYALVNPFTPFQAGDVPREMFFGRDGMVRELHRAEGSCLVYGGRQLGKSALLRQVQREFHNPTLERYCCLIDIKLVGDPQAGQDTEVLWRRLRDALRETGVLSSKTTADRPKGIDRAIRDALTVAPNRRMLVLFDEADNFLDADAKQNFKVVTGLRNLMSWSGRRFKVVFAGLHNVQRFQGIPNQPLAHFGRPLLVGPLEADAAYRLVREPLQDLGYRFDDTGTVLRILSYTNYHPGLIQLFCQMLLKRLQQRGMGESPPYPIHQADVEAIYRDQVVRESIRERLDWTLALDPRYQAVAWTMIVDQMQARDGYAKAYAAGELLGQVRGWWTAGFGAMSSDDLRGWLDEMCGLGILIRNTDGHYRLRSPNLVRLMGRDEDIANRLLELSERQPPAVFEADSHHAPLDELGIRYSPLTHAQERRLAPPQYGVDLVFASPALGLAGIADALARFLPAEAQEGEPSACTEIPVDRKDAGQVRGWLRTHLRESRSEGGQVVYQHVTGRAIGVSERVDAAIQFCQERMRAGRQWMRVAFLFDPLATWEWLSSLRTLREKVESRVDAAVSPKRWNRMGIRQRLEQQQKLSPEEVLSLVLKVTGGWPWLLDLLFDRARGTDDIRPAAAALEQELADPQGNIVGEFRASLGMGALDPALHVLRTVGTFGEVAEVDIAPDLIEGGAALTQDECGAALEFLIRMGCVERRESGMLVADPLVVRLLA
ncbi:MAG: hypothetical protein HY712_06520 [candidate division NC10 bacterium]|nr:hypothetical protein [candidate division NC10 bacterium]